MRQSEENIVPGSTDISFDSLALEERILIMSWRNNPELRRSLSRLLDLPDGPEAK